MARWIEMPLGMEVGLGSDHIVLGGEPSTCPKGAPPCNFRRPMSIVAKWLDGSTCYLVRRSASAQATLC